MAFHNQYRQWYCPMCNASQIKDALRNQQPADFHNQPFQSFFPGVPTPLQATPQSLEDRSPISGPLYYSMPPASLNQYPLPHQQELAMALAQQYYQIMQQQYRPPVAADQRQVPQQQIRFTTPPSGPAQNNSVSSQYPWWPTTPQEVPMQASWPAALTPYIPNQYVPNQGLWNFSESEAFQHASPRQSLNLLEDDITRLISVVVNGKMPTLDSEPYYINQHEENNSIYLGKVKMEKKVFLGFYGDSQKVDVYVTPYRLCYTFTPYANMRGGGPTGKALATAISLGSWLWSKAKKRKAGACNWFKIDMRGHSEGGSDANEANTEIHTKKEYFNFLTIPFFPFSLPVIIYRLIRPKKYIHTRTEYKPDGKKFSFLYRIRNEIRLTPKRADFATWADEIDSHLHSAQAITLEEVADFYSRLDIELTKVNKDYIF